ncbi:hypothetical protein PHYSODRAFT_388917, partial [Phytophthora sojae]
VAHGRMWVPCDSVSVDAGCQFSSRSTTFLWPAHVHLGEKSLIKYFYIMYPMGTLNETIRLTNNNLAASSFRSIGPGDFFRWIGIRCVNTPSNYGERFQMTRHCFEQIMYALSFSDNNSTSDPWYPIRPLIQGFNDQRTKHVSPGNIIVVDE